MVVSIKDFIHYNNYMSISSLHLQHTLYHRNECLLNKGTFFFLELLPTNMFYWNTLRSSACWKRYQLLSCFKMQDDPIHQNDSILLAFRRVSNLMKIWHHFFSMTVVYIDNVKLGVVKLAEILLCTANQFSSYYELAVIWWSIWT